MELLFQPTFWIAALAVIFIGISKAGFGGGLGILVTPLTALAFPSKEAVGILLPLLSIADMMSLAFYWKKWRAENLKYIIPAATIGIIMGSYMVGRFSNRELSVAIGMIAITFVVFQLVRQKIFQAEGTFAPNFKVGIPCGLISGITSTFAHGAGPIVAMFLVPQKLPKETYVGTTVLVFFFINLIKVPFFVWNGQITAATLVKDLYFIPFLPLGVWIGVSLNRMISPKLFEKIVYFVVFLAGMELVLKG